MSILRGVIVHINPPLYEKLTCNVKFEYNNTTKMDEKKLDNSVKKFKKAKVDLQKTKHTTVALTTNESIKLKSKKKKSSGKVKVVEQEVEIGGQKYTHKTIIPIGKPKTKIAKMREKLTKKK